jgi:hypothetical protein
MRPEWKMSEQRAQGPERIVATFGTTAEADRAIRRLEDAGVSREHVRIDDPSDEIAALEGQSRQEVDEAWAGPALGAATRGQTKWASMGTLAGGAIGAVLGVFIGFAPIPGLTLIPRLILGAAIGLTAGATIGMIIGGGWGPGVEGETDASDAQRGVTLGVRSKDREEIVRARRILEAEGAVRIDEYGAKGEPRLTDVRPGDAVDGGDEGEEADDQPPAATA